MEIKTTLDIFKEDCKFLAPNSIEEQNFLSKKWVSVDDLVKFLDDYFDSWKEINDYSEYISIVRSDLRLTFKDMKKVNIKGELTDVQNE